MKKLAALFFLLAYSISSFACTTFFLNKDGKMLFGRNYDWVTESGMVMVNARGMIKYGAKQNTPSFNWVSSYGSVTFNQYGKEFPTGGMNEKGLVIELMWLDETEYPARDKRNTLGVLQWIQYQLDCSQTVSEVIASDNIIRIEDDVPLHYLVADANGNAATIEFLDGKMVVHQKENLVFPVLTNTPYSEALEKTGGLMNTKSSIPYSDNSLARFAKACEMLQRTKTAAETPTVDYAFSILNNVSQGDYTKWSIVYDIGNRSIHFTTHSQKQRKSLSMRSLNFNCTAVPLAMDMNQPEKGEISTGLKPLTIAQNRKLVERSARESQSRVDINKSSVDIAVAVAGRAKCK